MKSIMMLLINGDKFFFEDKGLTLNQKDALIKLGDGLILAKPKLMEQTEHEVCSWFIKKAKDDLGIDLKRVSISLIVRIN